MNARVGQVPAEQLADDPGPAAPSRVTRTKKRRRAAHRRAFGAVRQLPSGRWQARYRGPDGLDRTAPATFASKSEADAWLATQQADLVRGTWRDPNAGIETFDRYLTAWLASRADLALTTRTKNAQLARDYLTPRLSPRVHLGPLPLRALTPTLIREWHAAALAEAHRRAGQPRRQLTEAQTIRAWAPTAGHHVAPTGRIPAALRRAWLAAGGPPAPTRPVPPSAGRAVAHSAYLLLHAALATASRDGLIPANPATLTRVAAPKTAERTPATPAEVAAIAAAMPERYRAAVHLAAWSGLRAGELFALRRRDLDLDRGTVRVDRAQVEVAGHPFGYGPPKSDAGRRTVHLPAAVLDQLTAHLAAFTGPHPDALIFTTTNGRPVQRATRHKPFHRARCAIGRPDLRWHDLRHTGATLAASAGASLAELQRRLGHSTVQAALIYQHATDDRDQLIAERLNDFATSTGTVVPLTPRTRRHHRTPAHNQETLMPQEQTHRVEAHA